VEDACKKVKILCEEAGVREVDHAGQNVVLLCLFLDVKLDVSKHGFKSILEAVGGAFSVRIVFFVVRNSK